MSDKFMEFKCKCPGSEIWSCQYIFVFGHVFGAPEIFNTKLNQDVFKLYTSLDQHGCNVCPTVPRILDRKDSQFKCVYPQKQALLGYEVNKQYSLR